LPTAPGEPETVQGPKPPLKPYLPESISPKVCRLFFANSLQPFGRTEVYIPGRRSKDTFAPRGACSTTCAGDRRRWLQVGTAGETTAADGFHGPNDAFDHADSRNPVGTG
jgi:hypothetical protein